MMLSFGLGSSASWPIPSLSSIRAADASRPAADDAGGAHRACAARAPSRLSAMPAASAIAATMKLPMIVPLSTAATRAGPAICPRLYQVVSSAAATGDPSCVPTPMVIMVTPMNVAPNRAAAASRRTGAEAKIASTAPRTCSP